MNKTFSAFLANAALATVAQAFTVTGVSAHQRWPWNNFIDIDFNIGGAAAGETFKIDVKATYANGSQTLIAKRFVTDPVVKGGNNRITWDIGLDCPNFKADDLRVAVTATPFTNGTDGAWMIIDLSDGKDATSYPVRYTTTPPEHTLGAANEPCQTTEMWLKRIKGGSFMFCQGYSSPGYFKVNMTKDYYIGVFECTQQQWAQVTGEWKSSFSNTAYRASRPCDNLARSNVFGQNGWPDVRTPTSSSFIAKMRNRTGLPSFNMQTEAQWEWAARCGYAGGMHPAYKHAEIRFNYPAYENVDFMCAPDEGGTAYVGTYPANPWGLYDMFGNLWDVCIDAGCSEANLRKYYGSLMGLSEEASTYDKVEVDDPIGGPVTGDYKASYQYYFVMRGASWSNSSQWLTLFGRQNNPDNVYGPTRGTRFTVLCE